MKASVRFLILTEDSGKQGQPTIQLLTRAALRLIGPTFDSRKVELSPLLDNPRASAARRGNAWKERRPTPDKVQLLGAIATRLMEDGGFVVFHVDSDEVWARRGQSENRQKFEKIVRTGVRQILMGAAQPPFGRRFSPLSETEAVTVASRLFVMHPCYSVEAWLYQSTAQLAAVCKSVHERADHQELIRQWSADRSVLDGVDAPKDGALIDCVAAEHNELLAMHFPAAEVDLARRSWSEFVTLLRADSRLLDRLAS